MTGDQPYRLPTGGLIDRSRRVSFRFDGRVMHGFAGDTLASALLANGVRLVGRSFKYHRPRGIFSAGSEEPNALMQLGNEGEPNILATMTELTEGLVARSQNRWPSLAFDLMSINDRLSRFLPAGFYYKTFMWPASGWKFYESFIRRAAGMGRISSHPDRARYETVHVHCDVLVVGGGPAGLAAALAAGRAGASVLLVDQGPELGGALRRERMSVDGVPGNAWAATAWDELISLPKVKVLTRATAFGYYDHNLVAVAEHVGESADNLPRQRLHLVRAGRVILAAGAIEQPIVFPDNDRPGIMLSGAARAYVNEFAVRPGKRAVIFTTSDDAYRTAFDLIAAGVEVAAVVDPRKEIRASITADMHRLGVECLAGHYVVATYGRRQLASVEVATPEGHPSRTISCDLLCVSGGWSPAIHLQSQTGVRPVYNTDCGVFLPGVPAQKECSVGGANGAGDLKGCLAEGFAAGVAAAGATGKCGAAASVELACDDGGFDGRLRVTRVTGPRGHAGKLFVDLQTDVTTSDVELAHSEGYVSVEHLKRYTTLGMGTDQGKTGNLAGLTAMSDLQGARPSEVGVTTFRPPFTPVSIGTLAGRDVAGSYAPTRFTPMHNWHKAAGARFVENGWWLRPQVYPRPGETLADSISREVLSVRRGVGIVDVTTLGKIDIQGPDAAAFLDHVYVNNISNLKVGRARYGVMLRDDGHVLDDGTVSRIGEQRFHVTTSTGHIDHVLSRLEFLLQTVWPDFKVSVTDVTENWAVMAVAGPRSREVLSSLLKDEDLSNEALPFLGQKTCFFQGMEVRLFRVSFSGELAYEVNVPAQHGQRVWAAIMEAGKAFSISPFGTEAMGVLRIEKGFIASGEIDGRTTPADLGLDRLLSQVKSYVGRPALRRPGLSDPARPRLVGLKPVESGSILRAGAHLLESPAPSTPASRPVTSIGRVTSAAFSPHLGHSIALALVSGAEHRMGSVMYAAFPLKNECVAVQVVEPVFVDASGGRARA